MIERFDTTATRIQREYFDLVRSIEAARCSSTRPGRDIAGHVMTLSLALPPAGTPASIAYRRNSSPPTSPPP
jgi:hypothetical protein